MRPSIHSQVIDKLAQVVTEANDQQEELATRATAAVDTFKAITQERLASAKDDYAIQDEIIRKMQKSKRTSRGK